MDKADNNTMSCVQKTTSLLERAKNARPKRAIDPRNEIHTR